MSNIAPSYKLGDDRRLIDVWNAKSQDVRSSCISEHFKVALPAFEPTHPSSNQLIPVVRSATASTVSLSPSSQCFFALPRAHYPRLPRKMAAMIQLMFAGKRRCCRGARIAVLTQDSSTKLAYSRLGR